MFSCPSCPHVQRTLEHNLPVQLLMPFLLLAHNLLSLFSSVLYPISSVDSQCETSSVKLSSLMVNHSMTAPAPMHITSHTAAQTKHHREGKETHEVHSQFAATLHQPNYSRLEQKKAQEERLISYSSFVFLQCNFPKRFQQSLCGLQSEGNSWTLRFHFTAKHH